MNSVRVEKKRLQQSLQKRVIFAGNPNCGKTTLFNALTGAHAKTGNWHGVTVGVCERLIKGENIVLADLPGIYSMDTLSLEEKITRNEIDGKNYDAVLLIADAVTLQRSMPLFRRAVASGKPAALIITMLDVLKRRGGILNCERLSEYLHIPVVAVDARSKKDIVRLRKFLDGFFAASGIQTNTNLISRKQKNCPLLENKVAENLLEVWEKSLPAQIYTNGKAGESKAEKFLFRPYIAVPLFFIVMALVFFLAFARGMPGIFLKDITEFLISDCLGGFLVLKIESTGAILAAEFVGAIFSGLGMLLSFLPQIAILYFALFMLEESGCMSALAFMTDGIFSRAGLTGRAAFSLLMGFGCTAAAALTTRGLENEKLQRRTLFILPYIPCSAKMPVFLTLVSAFFEHKFLALSAIYFSGVLFFFFAAFAARLIFRGENVFVMEVARLQFPSLRLVSKSLLFYLKQFIIKIVTVVSAFLIVSWFLLRFGMDFRPVSDQEQSILGVLSRGLKYLFYPMGIKDWRIALAAVSGLTAKESVAGMLNVFFGSSLSEAMSVRSAIAFTVFMLTCPPCISAIAASAKETGWARAIGYAAMQLGISFLFSYAVYGMLAFSRIAVPCCLGLCIAVFSFSFAAEKKKGKISEKNSGSGRSFLNIKRERRKKTM